jgi:hypothetical protein
MVAELICPLNGSATAAPEGALDVSGDSSVAYPSKTLRVICGPPITGRSTGLTSASVLN